MRYTEPNQPGSEEIAVRETTEERLRKEVEDLKRQLHKQKGLVHGSSHSALAKPWHPSALTIWSLFLGVIVLIVVAFFAGYIPLQKRKALVGSQAQEQEQALPRVEVIEVGRSSRISELQLPGNIQAVTEAPILARADGYIQRRLVDIGDRVQAGQPVAEIEAPELDQQVIQAKANLQQVQASLDQALANEQQGKANLARLDQMQAYRVVKAPFAGVITLRNVDVGALVNSGSTLLYRIAQTGTLRTYVNVPPTNASSMRPGQPAPLSVTNLPGRTFVGSVARTSNSLDPTSRTLLVEVQVPNPDGALLPGMYAQVDLSSSRP